MATEGTGKGAARELGRGWKISPSVRIKARTTFTLADINGAGAIQQIWMTPAPLEKARLFILRFFWDGETEPSVEVPVGDFFASGWGTYCQLSSLPVCVNPHNGLNCYWTMPFRKKAKITLENLDDRDMTLYYQVNYTLTDVPLDAAYFHAQFRRIARLPAKSVYTVLDGVRGRGQYVGTYLAWESHSPGWWGEGEMKFYFDGDKEFPTICGTGTEDYFCGSYDFRGEDPHYQTFSTPYSGLVQVLPPDGFHKPGQRFGLYRWHIADPVRFQTDFRATIHALGWKEGDRYLPLEDDIASVAYWYQTEPHAKFPPLPPKDRLVIKTPGEVKHDEEQYAATRLRGRKYALIPEPDKPIVSVNFCGLPVDEDALLLAGKLYHLALLDAGDTRITDRQLEYIEGLATLNHLVLSNTPVTDGGLNHLCPLSNLHTLYLADTKVSDRGLDNIARLSKLQLLDLSNTKITDDGMKKLVSLSNLNRLVLSRTGITDVGLAHLKRMKQLRRLDLSSTAVTDAAVKDLQMALPQLVIFR